jgi:hypothetical protein
MRYWPLPRQAASKPTAPGARLRSAQETRPTDISCRSTPGKSTGREIVERVAEAALGSVPLVGAALAGTLVTALGWRPQDGLSLESLAGNDLCTDAVVMATRTVEHTHQAEKIQALRNAVLNSVAPGAPDADSQAIMLTLVDWFTPSHLRLVTLWDDPPAWFASRGLPLPEAGMITSRTVTVEAGLPEMRGRKDFYLPIADELRTTGMLTAQLTGNVQPPSLMSRLTTDFGRQFVRFISRPVP